MVSSYCRRCRSHFEVADGEVVPNQTSEPLFGPPADQRPDPPPPAPPPSGPPIRTYKEKQPEDPPPATPVGPPIRIYQEKEAEEPAPAAPVGPPIRVYQEKEAEEPAPAAPVGPPIRTRKAEQVELVFDPPPSGPPIRTRKEDEAEDDLPRQMIGPPVRTRSEGDPIPTEWSVDPPPPLSRDQPSILDRLRDKIRPKPPQRSVLCNQCGRHFSAPAIANASNCPDCGAWLSLADFDINEPWNEPIVTRGNVIIRRKGWVTGIDIDCHDLLIEGRLKGSARCTGRLVIRRSGMIRGKLRCNELRIERWAKVQFIHPVETGRAVINGRVIGSIRAESTVTLLGRSRIAGNVAATDLIMKRGARHTGRLRIVASGEASAASESAV